jgi:hypothetical protein
MLQASSCVEHASCTADGATVELVRLAGAIHLVAGRAFNQGDRLRRFETRSPSQSWLRPAIDRPPAHVARPTFKAATTSTGVEPLGGRQR